MKKVIYYFFREIKSLGGFFFHFSVKLYVYLLLQPVGIDPDDLEAELEKDLGGLDLGDVDTTGVDLDDDDLLDDDDELT